MNHLERMREQGIERLYLGGPMSGQLGHGGPAFETAAAELRRLAEPAGIYVHNPFKWEDVDPDNPREAREPWEVYLAKDLPEICASDGLVLLDGWEESRGATFEGLVARVLCRAVFSYSRLRDEEHLDDARIDPGTLVEAFLGRWSEELLPGYRVLALPPDDDQAEPSVLEEAMDLVRDERMEEYGHPADNFAAIGRVWTGLLRNFLREGAEVEGWMVPWLMIGLKACRQLTGQRKRDNPLDVAGYLRADELAAKRAGEDW